VIDTFLINDARGGADLSKLINPRELWEKEKICFQ